MPGFYARHILSRPIRSPRADRVRQVRRTTVLTASAAVLSVTAVISAPAAQAAPPTPVTAATARTYLAELTVKTEGSTSGYSRDMFPHWITQSGACDTRETVLKRDGTNVVTNSSCSATSGTWKSAYDGATWTAASDVDIDHVVSVPATQKLVKSAVHRVTAMPPTSAATSFTPASDPAQQLDELTVAARGSMDGYSRDKFPHWINQGDNCDTREVVLKRDGTNVKTGSDCYPTSGTWKSPYDGAIWTKPSDVDIDHMVPLGNSWVSGARSWTTAQRQAFANDLTEPQLFAVTDNVNQSKGDRAPDEWRPPLNSDWCAYSTDWIEVKHHYKLTVTSAEKTALKDMLATC